jgi:5-methylcytosine-specific restriction endonuclease McrA
MPNIPKRDRKRPWKSKPRNTKPARSFREDGTPVRPFDGTPTGSDVDPRLKTARWQRFRAAVIQRWPVCPICDHMGRTTPSTDADHISPRHRNEFDMFDIANVWALCRDCHQVKSHLERQRIHHETLDGWIQHVARIRGTRK